MFSFNTSRFSRLNADWSVENINPDMTPNVMSLDISISPENQKKKEKNNKHLILIRLDHTGHKFLISIKQNTLT